MDEVGQPETTTRKSIGELRWTDTQELSRYVTETGRILSRQYTRLSAKDQRQLTRLIKRARNMLLMK